MLSLLKMNGGPSKARELWETSLWPYRGAPLEGAAPSAPRCGHVKNNSYNGAFGRSKHFCVAHIASAQRNIETIILNVIFNAIDREIAYNTKLKVASCPA